MAANYPVVPIPTGWDAQKEQWPERLEVDDFVDPKRDPKQVFLFLAAFAKLQERKATEALSYFQIAGIHGRPYRRWPPRDPESPPEQGEDEQGAFGYCVHGDVTFISWHRVYVLQIERALYDIMHDMIKSGPGTENLKSPIPEELRPSYKKSFTTFRLPYWDFTSRKPYNNDFMSLPRCAVGETLKDTGKAYEALELGSPPGWLAENADKPNPLYSFAYPTDPAHGQHQPSDLGIPHEFLADLKTTTRHPFVGNSKKIVNIQAMKDAFESDSAEVRRNLMLAFQASTMRQFSETGYNFRAHDEFDKERPDVIPSLESIHGSGHLLVGGKKERGNMALVPLAGFDPIFFLYHCNIDRLIALWQAGHPKPELANWVERHEWRQAAVDPVTKNRIDGPLERTGPIIKSNVDETTPLEPFYHQNGHPWTSKNLRDLSELNYTYDSLEGVNDFTTMLNRIDIYYDESFQNPKKVPVDVVMTVQFEISAHGQFVLISYLKEEGKEDEELGRIVNFVNPLEAPCPNCEANREARKLRTLSTTLTTKLVKIFGDDYAKLDFEALLRKRMYWAVYQMKENGPIRFSDEEVQKSFKILVTTRKNVGTRHGTGLEAGEHLPSSTALFGATEGKAGGLGSDGKLTW